MADSRDGAGSQAIDPDALFRAVSSFGPDTVLGDALRRRQAESREGLPVIAGFANQMPRR